MDIILALWSFIFGTIIGSFLNVIALRWNTGFGLKGRSNCMSCGYVLEWKDLIPVLSFLYVRGKCRVCKTKISYQYPIVEVMTGLLFFLIFWKFTNPFEIGIHLIIASLFVIGVIYDLKHKIIPDAISYSVIVLSFILLWAKDVPDFNSLIAGAVVALPFWFLVLISKETWMGGGDAKLAIAIGWMLGISQGFSALAVASWIGACVGIPLLFLQKKSAKIKKLEIPFAPFLTIGLYIILFSGIDIFYAYNFI